MESFEEIYRGKVTKYGDTWVARDFAILELERQRDKLFKELRELKELKKTFFDFMQNIDNYNVEFPTIMYDEWNEVNKLLGRD